jgi:hypothetical protein
MISAGGEVWASTEAMAFSSSHQRSSVYAQTITETVGLLGNSSLLPGTAAEPATRLI